MINKLIRFSLQNPLVIVLFTIALLTWGIIAAPFSWKIDSLPRDPIPVDAIPDIGENQQIVFTKWIGKSPQDIEDQITYPLTTALLGLPEVKTIRSYSMFGFSSIYVIFNEDAEFYWTRSRILEKLNSLPPETLPNNVTPQLGPDATSLGQVFWYTLEGFNEDGEPSGGWDLHELRSAQDWHIRYALQGVEGVAEVSSIGGYVKEYQVDVNPDALRAFNIKLDEVFNAVRESNMDTGARTIEINSVEYIIRGIGTLESVNDLRNTVITQHNNTPITLDQIAEVEIGPATRRGALDKAGAEAVGGVVVARYGENPLEVINRIKDKIIEISPGLPRKTLENGRQSQIKIVPFYDRTGLINETIKTLENTVRQQIIITIVVVVLLLLHFRSAVLISGMLPLSILFSFICMNFFNVDANIVALSGIAIAIGTIVDIGVVLIENILKHIDESPPKKNSLEVVYQACSEVSGAVVTAVLTTIISFLPIFTMEAAEGKLFRPLAYTKTFALIGSIVVALTIIPPLAHWILTKRSKSPRKMLLSWGFLAVGGILGTIFLNEFPLWLGLVVITVSSFNLLKHKIPLRYTRLASFLFNGIVAITLSTVLAIDWQPFGVERNWSNLLIVFIIIFGSLGFTYQFTKYYTRILRKVLRFKWFFLSSSLSIILFGTSVWIGFENVFQFIPSRIQKSEIWNSISDSIPGLEKEFMPNLDEGSFLFMPTMMPHASIGEAMDVLKKQDMAINAIPEVELVVGKIGRTNSPLDPAPISMIETIITYKNEYIEDKNGDILKFSFDKNSKRFNRDKNSKLIPEKNGKPYRQWRDHIRNENDIWKEIVKVSKIPGTTSAPKLQPIAARVVMLQSGMRAPMGMKVFGSDLKTIEATSLKIEQLLKQVPNINANTVFADRTIGKPYLEIDIDREAIARYGIKILDVQNVIEIAIGGKTITNTIEDRERYPVRVRYQRELRDSIEEIERILVASPNGSQIPLREITSINYLRGPQAIKSENTFLVNYVIFDKQDGHAEVDVVDEAETYLDSKIQSGELTLPIGVSYQFTGNYENQLRAEKRLSFVLPIALGSIFLILYFQFKRISMTLLVFSGIAFAWSGGFTMLWLYNQDWFLNFELFGTNFRELFQITPINLSVAVWVGFLALFGIATDDGVLMTTYLQQQFAKKHPNSRNEIHEAVIEAASRRVRAATTTSATTLLALLPILTSSGRGSDIMIPMAIPTFGGMLFALISIFIVPVLYCIIEEFRNKQNS